MNDILTEISGFIWGWPMIIMLLGTHLLLTIRLKFPQRYIFKAIRLIVFYRVVFVLFIFIGAVLELNVVWNLSDIMNALMALPNLIALIGLSGVLVKDTRYYLWEGHLDEETF